jgi:hypothetical protein
VINLQNQLTNVPELAHLLLNKFFQPSNYKNFLKESIKTSAIWVQKW